MPPTPHPQIPPLPEQIPGEPALPVPSLSRSLSLFAQQVVSIGLRVMFLWPLAALYAALRLVLPRPPHIPSLRRYLRLLYRIVCESPPPPGLPPRQRLFLLLHVLRRGAALPLRGLAWYLDDLLYGPALAGQRIVAPLFELSAARSGSTQIAHYLEDDPQLVTPTSGQTEVPYLWLWRIFEFAFAHGLSKDKLRELVHKSYPAEFLQRHELDPLRTDTFEMQFCHAQLVGITLFLGPQAMLQEMDNAALSPCSRDMWQDDFLRYLDGIARKRLLLARLSGDTLLGDDPPAGGGGGPARRLPRRLMIKGHFLNVADDLARRYPDACFLTMVRAPAARLQSVINFHRVQPRPPGVQPPPWNWLVERSLDGEIDYCDRELVWFSTSTSGPGRRVVVRFSDYVRDLAGTMQHVYRSCLSADEVPPHVPKTHTARARTGYAIDRSLDQLHIDRDWLSRRLADYIDWCGEGPRR